MRSAHTTQDHPAIKRNEVLIYVAARMSLEHTAWGKMTHTGEWEWLLMRASFPFGVMKYSTLRFGGWLHNSVKIQNPPLNSNL